MNFYARARQVLIPEIEEIFKFYCFGLSGLHRSANLRLYGLHGPDQNTAQVTEPIRQTVAAGLPILLIAAAYSSGGKTYSLLQPNPADPPILVILLTEVFYTFGPLTYVLATFLGKDKVSHKVRWFPHCNNYVTGASVRC